MSTLQQILEEAMKLPPEDRLRLRAALDRLEANGDLTSGYKNNEQERAWIEAHREHYLNQWVALDGDRLLAHGADAKRVYDEATEQGITSPYLERVTPQQEANEQSWDALAQLLNECAIDTGITDLAQQHDHGLTASRKS